MKLCPRAVAIRQGYWSTTENEKTKSIHLADKKAMVRALHKHMSFCHLCSK